MLDGFRSDDITVDQLEGINRSAIILKDQGHLDEAKSICERAIEGYEKILGHDHESTTCEHYKLVRVRVIWQIFCLRKVAIRAQISIREGS